MGFGAALAGGLRSACEPYVGEPASGEHKAGWVYLVRASGGRSCEPAVVVR